DPAALKRRRPSPHPSPEYKYRRGSRAQRRSPRLLFTPMTPRLALCLLLALATLSARAVLPPPGVEIPAADRKALEAGVAELAKEIDQLKSNPLWPDVAIFHKAVDWPLRYNEFLNVKDVAKAKAALATGLARAKDLKAGKSP